MLSQSQMLELVLEMKSELDINDESEYNEGFMEGVGNLEYAARMSDVAIDMTVRSWLDGDSVAMSEGDTGYRDAILEFSERASEVNSLEEWSFA